jgi:hypothetical protein
LVTSRLPTHWSAKGRTSCNLSISDFTTSPLLSFSYSLLSRRGSLRLVLGNLSTPVFSLVNHLLHLTQPLDLCPLIDRPQVKHLSTSPHFCQLITRYCVLLGQNSTKPIHYTFSSFMVSKYASYKIYKSCPQSTYFPRDGKCNKRGWACTPRPHQPGLILPS